MHTRWNLSAFALIFISIFLSSSAQLTTSQPDIGSSLWWGLVASASILLILASLSTGISAGLMDLDVMTLKALKQTGDDVERNRARFVLPLVKRHNLVMVTLLAVNTIAYISIPVALIELHLQTWLVLIISVVAIVLFAEVLPTALCTGKGLSIGFYCSPLVWIFIAVLAVFTWPLSKTLQCLVSQDNKTFFNRRQELGNIIEQHGNMGQEDEFGDAPLTQDEVRIIRGALNMRAKTCSSVFTPLHKVFSLTLDTLLDSSTRKEIIRYGHSRIPVFHKKGNHFLGIILAKNILAVSPDTYLKDLPLVQAPQVTTDTPLFTLLNQFMLGKSHMAIVLNKDDHMTVVGVVTLEDVIEELLQSEIYDEKDMQIRARPEIFGEDQDTLLKKIPGARIIEMPPHPGLRPVRKSTDLNFPKDVNEKTPLVRK